jgi:DNA-binding NarL/FixJ family response regulator
MKRTRILLADDHSLIVQGIQRLLATRHDIVGTAGNGKDLVEAALRLAPDLIVLDISMPILNGIDAAREIIKALPATKLVFLTMHSSPIYLRKALEAGGSGYVLKSGAFEELLTAIDEAGQGRSYVSPGFAQEVRDNIRDWPGKSTRVVIELTGRQRQILQLIAEGKQNKEIAHILNVSVKTVEFHRSRLMAKLGTHTVAELTRFAVQEGLLDGVDSL